MIVSVVVVVLMAVTVLESVLSNVSDEGDVTEGVSNFSVFLDVVVGGSVCAATSSGGVLMPGPSISAGGATVSSLTAELSVVTDIGSSLELPDMESGVTSKLISLDIVVSALTGSCVLGYFNSGGADDSDVVSGCRVVSVVVDDAG